MLFHRRDNIVQRAVLLDGDHQLRHRVLGGVAARVLALGDDATDDVAVGDDADELVVGIDDGNFTAYEMAQQVIDAAEAEARKNKWNVTIVVTDGRYQRTGR